MGLFQLLVLHLNAFKIRQKSSPSSTPFLQKFVSYALAKYKCPFSVQATAHSLLLAFGYLINHIDLFGKYDSNFVVSPTSMSSVEELNSLASAHLQKNLPVGDLTCNNILSIYRGLVSEIRNTYAQINYTAGLITQIHDTDPSLDPEDIWVASSEERIQNYTEIMDFNEKIGRRKEEEYKHRAVFWKWLEGLIDSVESGSEVNELETNNVDFERITGE